MLHIPLSICLKVMSFFVDYMQINNSYAVFHADACYAMSQAYSYS